MKTREDYLEELRAIKKDDWNLPKTLKADEYALELYPFLGDPDPEMRDELALTMIWVLIDREKLTKNTCRDLLEWCQKDGIFHEIDQPRGEGVYKRSFALLVIAALLEDHVKAHRSWMRKDKFMELVESLLAYAVKEQDFHGFTEEFGWAHTVAHFSDALSGLAACKELSEEQANRLFAAMLEKMQVANYGYIHGEDERMARATCGLIQHEQIGLLDWEEILESQVQGPDQTLPGYLRLQQEHNMKAYLRSLVARIQRLGLDQKWTFPVISALRKYDVKY